MRFFYEFYLFFLLGFHINHKHYRCDYPCAGYCKYACFTHEKHSVVAFCDDAKNRLIVGVVACVKECCGPDAFTLDGEDARDDANREYAKHEGNELIPQRSAFHVVAEYKKREMPQAPEDADCGQRALIAEALHKCREHKASPADFFAESRNE